MLAALPRFLTQYKLAGTRSFRLSASQLFGYGGNCLTGDTEVYTPDGWVRLDQFVDHTPAMCWNDTTGELYFASCKGVHVPGTGVMHEFIGINHTLAYTEDHRIPYKSAAHTAYKVRTPREIVGKNLMLPISGMYAGSTVALAPNEAALLVMVQADFSYKNGWWRGTFRKEHKKRRFLELMQLNQIEFSTHQGDPDYMRVAFKMPHYVERYIDTITKNFDHTLLQTTVTTRQRIIAELGMWDGSYRGDSVVYVNTNHHNIQFIQLLAHTIGWRGTISITLDNNRGYGRGKNKTLYKLNLRPSSTIWTGTLQHRTSPAPAMVHCLRTPTGFFMTRRDGVIQITGNCQNNDKDSLDIFEAPDGWSIVSADQAGAEALIVAYLAKPGRYRELFTEGVKPHIYVALHLFLDKFRGDHPRDRYWLKSPAELKRLPEWPELSKRVASSKFEYDIGKRTGHACCDDQTEVLTPNGWVNISAMPEVIMTGNLEGFGNFTPVIWNRYPYEGNLYHFHGEEVDQCVTATHKMVYKTNGYHKFKPAALLACDRAGTRNMVNVIEAQGIGYSHQAARLAAAIQADGHFSFNKIRFHFKKLRKVERLEDILHQAGIYPEWSVFGDGNHKCTIEKAHPFVRQALTLLTADKKWSPTILKLHSDVLHTITDEVCYWDGHHDKSSNRRSYCTIHASNAELIKTAAHLCGVGSTHTTGDNIHIVSFNRRRVSMADHVQQVHYSGYVYCPTTALGCFLIRRNGKISLTGNSNYKMGPNTFRDSCLKESEGTLVLSFQEAVFFLGTYKSLFPEIVEWQDEIERTITSERLLRNLFGYPRRFERLFSDGYTREAISWIPQSTVGCITHRAFGITGAALNAKGRVGALFNNKHDSLAVLVRDPDVPWAAATLAGALDVELTGRDGVKFRMKNEVQVGKNMKKAGKDNPLGLKDYKL